MFANNKPTYNLKTNITESARAPKEIGAGGIGFGAWSTQVEFKEVRINKEGQYTNLDLSNFRGDKGDWIVKNGVLTQTSSETPSKGFFSDFKGNDFTLEFKARKTGGSEGFIVYLAMTEDNKKGFAFNIGGWGNSSTIAQKVADGGLSDNIGQSTGHTIETNKWYDVKIVIKSNLATLYMDGKEIKVLQNTSVPKQFYAAGYDEASGEVVVKVVNGAGLPYDLDIKLDGVAGVKNIGKIISIKADNATDENSFENPRKIYPKEEAYSFSGKDFSYSFAPYSFTIFRVKVDGGNH
jgi:alpha-L-arabinofuranosidase